MAERNNNLMICSLLNTEPAGRGGGGWLAAAARTIFLRSYSLEKAGPYRNPLGAQPWVARLRPAARGLQPHVEGPGDRHVH